MFQLSSDLKTMIIHLKPDYVVDTYHSWR